MKTQELKLIREATTPKAGGESYTLGKMYRNGLLFGQTDEDEDRFLETGKQEKVHGRTAIPRGRYRVITSYSPHFGRVLPELLSVPHFSGIRIHGGNTAEDSEGCILLGRVRTRTGIAQCADLVQRLIDLIDEAWETSRTETWIEVS